jgi:hypothetical protein
MLSLVTSANIIPPSILFFFLIILVIGGIPRFKDTFLGKFRKWCDEVDDSGNIIFRVICFPFFLNKCIANKKSSALLVYMFQISLFFFLVCLCFNCSFCCCWMVFLDVFNY